MNYRKWDNFEDSDDDGGEGERQQVEERRAEIKAHARRADSLFNIAEASHDDGRMNDYATALDAYNEVLQAVANSQTFHQLGDDGVELAVSANLNISCICIRLERWDQAVMMADAALKLHRSHNRPQPLLSSMKLMRAHYFSAYALLMKSKHASSRDGGKVQMRALSRALKESAEIKRLMRAASFFDDSKEGIDRRDEDAVPESQRQEYERLCTAIEERGAAIRKGHADAGTSANSTGRRSSDADAADTDRFKEMHRSLSRGEELMEQGKLDEAKKWYSSLLDSGDSKSKSLLRNCPSSQLAELYYGQATILQRVGHRAEAAAAIMKCSEHVDDGVARKKLCLRAGSLLFSAKKYSEAFESYAMVLQSSQDQQQRTDDMIYYVAMAGQASCLVRQKQELKLAEQYILDCINFFEQTLFTRYLPQCDRLLFPVGDERSIYDGTDNLLQQHTDVLKDLQDISSDNADTATELRDADNTLSYGDGTVSVLRMLNYTILHLVTAYSTLQDCAAEANEWRNCDDAIGRTIDCSNFIIQFLQLTLKSKSSAAIAAGDTRRTLLHTVRKHRALAACGKARLYADGRLESFVDSDKCIKWGMKLPTATDKRNEKLRLMSFGATEQYNCTDAEYTNVHLQHYDSAFNGLEACWSFAAVEFIALDDHVNAYGTYKVLAEHWMQQGGIEAFELDNTRDDLIAAGNDNGDGLVDIAEKAHDSWRQCALISSRQINAHVTDIACSSGSRSKEELKRLRYELCCYRQQVMLSYYYAGICAYVYDVTLAQRAFESAQEIEAEVMKFIDYTIRSRSGGWTKEKNAFDPHDCAAFYSACGDLSYHLGQTYIRQGAATSALGEAESALQHYERSVQILYDVNDDSLGESLKTRRMQALGLKALAFTVMGQVSEAETALSLVGTHSATGDGNEYVASLRRMIVARKQQMNDKSSSQTPSDEAQRLSAEFSEKLKKRGNVAVQQDADTRDEFDINFIVAVSILVAAAAILVALLMRLLL